MKHLILSLVVASTLATCATAQTFTGQHGIDVYTSGSSASSALSDDRASLLPARTTCNTGYCNAQSVSYLLVFPAGSFDSPVGVVNGANLTEPTTLTYHLGTCTTNYSGWTTEAKSTRSAAVTFYNGLSPVQQAAALIFSAPGSESLSDRWVILYRPITGHFCS